MSHDVLECLNVALGTPYLVEVLTEKVLDFVKEEDNILKARKKGGDSYKKRNEIPDLPLQDAIWSVIEIAFKHHDLSTYRMLVLSDTTSRPSTVQFSLEKVSCVSYEDQTMQLLSHGCLDPLDGKKSRRPQFLCLDTPYYDRETIFAECDRLGVYFCGELSSKEEFCAFQQKFKNSKTFFRQCSVCGISGMSGMFDECDKCGAVLYCGKRCQREDWEESHHEWCSQFKRFMDEEAELADMPFSFVPETTSIDFHDQKHRVFLKKFGLDDQGLWRLACPADEDWSLQDTHANRDKDLDDFSIFGLHEESRLLQTRPPHPPQPLNGWKDYYSMRGFHLTSPIAVLLHYPLTLYYIITQLLPSDFEEAFTSIHQSGSVSVHVIGVEKEVEMWLPFLECARLLAPLTLDLHLFGVTFDPKHDGQTFHKENLHIHTFRGLYHDRVTKQLGHLQSPSLAVCFNGGIGAYTSYLDTIRLLMSSATPLYYTDYGQACVAFTTTAISTISNIGQVSPPAVNPFRCPLRLVASDQNLPRYSNGFISHIKPVLRSK